MFREAIANYVESPGLTISSGTPPAGTTVTASGTANAKGSWAALGSAISQQCCLCMVVFRARDAGSGVLWDFGVDQAGGTSYDVIIGDLPAYNGNTSGYAAKTLLLPVFLKAGAKLACRVQGSVGSESCTIWTSVYAGNHPTADYFEVLGENTGSSVGVSIDPGGSTSKTSWATLESATSKELTHVCPLAYVDPGIGTTTPYTIRQDIAIEVSATQHIIIGDHLHHTDPFEVCRGDGIWYPTRIPAGSKVVTRIATDAGNDSRDDMDVGAIGMFMEAA